MSYRFPDVLIKERKGTGLVISILFVAVCISGVCRGLQLAEQGQGSGSVPELVPGSE
ncbi:MAG: hypothetical protein ABI895_17605 [Deltaproteobacteria bacterium]